MFAQALTTTPHLSSSGLSKMVYDHFLGCFIPKGPSLSFLGLFQVVIVAHADILRSMALMLETNKFLTMTKTIENLHPIVIGEMFFRLINRSIVL